MTAGPIERNLNPENIADGIESGVGVGVGAGVETAVGVGVIEGVGVWEKIVILKNNDKQTRINEICNLRTAECSSRNGLFSKAVGLHYVFIQNDYQARAKPNIN